MNRAVLFEYDAASRVQRQLFLGDLREIRATYDASGNVSTLTPPGKPAHAFAYTPIDLESQYTPPSVAGSGANVTDYSWNADRQLTGVTRPDLATITSAYGSTTGRLTSIAHAHDTITTAYSGTTGRLTALVSSGAGLAFGYDAFLPTSEEWSGAVAGTVSRTFNNDLRLASESVNGGSTVPFTYDNDGLLTGAGALAITRNATNGLLSATALGVVATSRTWNAFAETLTDVASVSGTEVLRNEFTRDALGRITARTETVGGVTSEYEYFYDAAGRLVRVDKDGSQHAAYGFDANGNRTSSTSGGMTASGTYDDQDRLLSYAGVTYSWSANGELTSRTDVTGTTAFEYDALGNLRHVDLPGGDDIDYIVDGRNRRIGKKVNGVEVEGFLYRDQLEPVAWLDSAGNVVARFVYGSKAHVPDYMVKGGVTYRIVSDHLGSVRLVINATTGAIAQRMDFDEWGNVTLDTAPGFQPFGFAGGLWDADTGLVRFGARDYDPRVGRWTAKDPIRFRGKDTNLYEYGYSDPVNVIDPRGTCGAFSGAYKFFQELWHGSQIREDAIAEQKKRFPDGDPLGTTENKSKFRHYLAACTASSRFGEADARMLGWLNEYGLPRNYFPSAWEGSKQDLVDNEVGLDLARDLGSPTFEDCADAAYDEVAPQYGPFLEEYGPPAPP